jgi:GTP-binding protein HflX
VPVPIVALVGYTNAGKSTLFNALTGAGVYAQDQLFATLDPTMRAIALPSGRTVILSDTVGFISELPTQLVEAFRATLEEVAAADVILHVRDAAHPDTAAQRADVLGVLRDMTEGGDAPLDEGWEARAIEVLNKVDLMHDRPGPMGEGTVAVSALTGDGLDDLRRMLDKRLGRHLVTADFEVAPGDGAGLAWLYRHGEVLSRADADDAIRLSVRLSEADRARFAGRAEG